MSSTAAAKTDKKPQSAVTPVRADDFPQWYQAVVRAADMAENSVVRGCMVIKPYGFAVWENVQAVLGGMIRDQDVQNAYFPLLIPLSFISKEADHVDGFAKECAVVTHHRLEKGPDGGLVPAAPLAEPYVIRPTSETIIGHSMAQWVQSYRDLPLKLNQWCNVMRWEMRPRVFLRSAEFLWQEGHNCFETPAESRADALKMLDVYADFAEGTLAMPVIKGEKTADERFPGAIATYTIEAMMQDGKALQAGTSHDLGQTFAHSSDIKFQSREGQEAYAWTTSWGVSTRLIGGMIMVHGDDDGMVMPPRIAPHQVVIIPVLRGEDGDNAVLDAAADLQTRLKAAGIRVKLDNRDERTPTKMWDAIKKGVPVRVEIGAREAAAGQLTHVRRDLGRDSKKTEGVDDFIAALPGILDAIHDGMLSRARDLLQSRIFDMDTLEAARAFFADEAKTGFVRIDVALTEDPAFEALKKDFSVTTRCMPFADGGRKVLIGRSY